MLAFLNVSITLFTQYNTELFVGMKIFSTICKFGLRVVLLLLVMQFGQSLIVKSSETQDGDVVITGINAVTGKELFSVIFNSGRTTDSHRQSLSSMGATTNEILDSHANDEGDLAKNFENLDPEALIIVSTFLARSPTSYGKGFELLSS